MVISHATAGAIFPRIFTSPLPLIGMIHLAPLPGYPTHPGIQELTRKALSDLATLESAGFDGVLVENDNDQPHHIRVPTDVRDAFAEVMRAVLAAAHIPVGMEIIYDMPATVAVAHEVGAHFVRLDVFADSVETRYGIVPASAEQTTQLRRALGAPELLFFTDVHVKHAKLLANKSLSQSATESIALGSNGLIITGDWTGKPPSIEDLDQAQQTASNTPVIIGSGLTATNAPELLAHADAAIVGTSIKTGDAVDPDKAVELVAVVERIRAGK